jgi:hypothetical protein
MHGKRANGGGGGRSQWCLQRGCAWSEESRFSTRIANLRGSCRTSPALKPAIFRVRVGRSHLGEHGLRVLRDQLVQHGALGFTASVSGERLSGRSGRSFVDAAACSVWTQAVFARRAGPRVRGSPQAGGPVASGRGGALRPRAVRLFNTLAFKKLSAVIACQ